MCPQQHSMTDRARDDHDEDGDGNDDDGKEVCATADGDRATLDGSRERLCDARVRLHPGCARFEPVSPAGAARKNNLRKRVGRDTTIPSALPNTGINTLVFSRNVWKLPACRTTVAFRDDCRVLRRILSRRTSPRPRSSAGRSPHPRWTSLSPGSDPRPRLWNASSWFHHPRAPPTSVVRERRRSAALPPDGEGTRPAPTPSLAPSRTPSFGPRRARRDARASPRSTVSVMFAVEIVEEPPSRARARRRPIRDSPSIDAAFPARVVGPRSTRRGPETPPRRRRGRRLAIPFVNPPRRTPTTRVRPPAFRWRASCPPRFRTSFTGIANPAASRSARTAAVMATTSPNSFTGDAAPRLMPRSRVCRKSTRRSVGDAQLRGERRRLDTMPSVVVLSRPKGIPERDHPVANLQRGLSPSGDGRAEDERRGARPTSADWVDDPLATSCSPDSRRGRR